MIIPNRHPVFGDWDQCKAQSWTLYKRTLLGVSVVALVVLGTALGATRGHHAGQVLSGVTAAWLSIGAASSLAAYLYYTMKRPEFERTCAPAEEIDEETIAERVEDPAEKKRKVDELKTEIEATISSYETTEKLSKTLDETHKLRALLQSLRELDEKEIGYLKHEYLGRLRNNQVKRDTLYWLAHALNEPTMDFTFAITSIK